MLDRIKASPMKVFQRVLVVFGLFLLFAFLIGVDEELVQTVVALFTDSAPTW